MEGQSTSFLLYQPSDSETRLEVHLQDYGFPSPT